RRAVHGAISCGAVEIFTAKDRPPFSARVEQPAFFLEVSEHLLEEERISVRLLMNDASQRGRRRRAAEGARQVGAASGRQSLQRDPRRQPLAGERLEQTREP